MVGYRLCTLRVDRGVFSVKAFRVGRIDWLLGLVSAAGCIRDAGT